MILLIVLGSAVFENELRPAGVARSLSTFGEEFMPHYVCVVATGTEEGGMTLYDPSLGMLAGVDSRGA